MKNKKQNTNNKNNIQIVMLILLAIIMFFIVVVTSLSKIIKQDDTISIEQSEVDIQKQQEEINKKTEEDVIISKLATMQERDRMEFYFSQFIKMIENKDYEKAYEMLYDEFKTNYFPTLNEFKEYAKKTFPSNMTVDHENIERSGNIYVLYVKISDFLASKENAGKEMRFVIQEEDLNNYVMSFSVI